MEFLKIKGNDELFVLFHGTGGNDMDLLHVVEKLNPKASILSFLGNVESGVSRRFFAPLTKGLVDRVDLEKRVEDFLELWTSLEKEWTAKEVIFIGYSNGANFILALLEKVPDIATKTILLHPSDLGWSYEKIATNNKLLMTLGAKDYIAPAGPIVQLINKMKDDKNFDVDYILGDGGHEIDDKELEKIKKWL